MLSPMTNTILVTGNTYPHRVALKALGGRWEPASKGWRVPASNATAARALVASPETKQSRWVDEIPARGPYGRCMRHHEDGDGSCGCGRPGCGL